MAGAELAIVRRVRALLGDDISIEAGDGRVPLVTPRTENQLELLLHTASAERWRVRVHGAGTWIPRDAPADLAVSLAGLTEVPLLDASDLVATAQAGVRWGALRQRAADGGAWVALDPPGWDRTVGSVVATGTAGPLRSGFGGLRDHVLGLTMITGDGRRLEVGGRVVKNVAGFDVAKVATGGYGAFGVITSVTLRLRALPRADTTLAMAGPRDALLEAARAISAAGLTPAAMELASPDAAESVSWKLGVRFLGSDEAVTAERDEVTGLADQAAEVSTAEGDASLWTTLLTGHAREPVTVRLGTLPESLEDALDLVEHHLPDGRITVTVGVGSLRWSGNAAVDDLRRLRHTAALREWPLTLERAPWPLRSELGHFGRYREGVARLVDGLRHTLDPTGTLVVPVDSPA